MNKIIVDGYNMIHRVASLRKFLDDSLEAAREQLIRYLRSYLMRSKVHITLVFDGNHAPVDSEYAESRSLTVLFSQYPFKADPVIKDLIRREEHKSSLTLVSDDSDIVRFARDHGCQVLSPEGLYRRIEKRFSRKELNNKFDQDLTEEEIAEWLQIFGADDKS